MSQGTQSITMYYNQFKGVWDEFLSYRPLYRCDCGAMDQCKCNILVQLQATRQTDAVIQFLTGLDVSYKSVRSQLLSTTPVPTLSQVYSVLLNEESQRNLGSNSSTQNGVHPMDAMAMYAQQGGQSKYNYKDKKPVVCTYCKYNGHTEDK